MNQRIEALVAQTAQTLDQLTLDREQPTEDVLREFARKVAQEAVRAAREKWYQLNNASALSDETPRDVGLRVGTKAGVLKAINAITQEFDL